MADFSGFSKRLNETPLMPHKTEIIEMRKENISFRQIKLYLESEYGIEVGTLSNLMSFFKRHCKPRQEISRPKEKINILTNKMVQPESNEDNDRVLASLQELQTPQDDQGKKLQQRRDKK